MLRTFAFAFLGLISLSAGADSLWITEYVNPSPVLYQAAQAPPTASQVVAITAASVQSAAFNASTRLVRVTADASCSVQIGGTNPTATTTSARMAAGTPEYFIVAPGDKLAVIKNP